MDYRKLIVFYKGYVLKEIHKELIKYDDYTISEIDCFLKCFSQTEKSCVDMNFYELQELIIWSFIFGDEIGIYLNFKDNEWIEEI